MDQPTAPSSRKEEEEEEAAHGDVIPPPYFLCPISLELMVDPVTLPTGITYDRDSIDEWLSLSAAQPPTCPVTKLPLPRPLHLTPNATLRRLIQAWCAAHPSLPPLRQPPPSPAHLLRDAPRHLRELHRLASSSDRHRRSLDRAGAGEAMLRILRDPSSPPAAREGSLAVLRSLRLPDDSLRALAAPDRDALARDLARELTAEAAPPEARADAASLLRAVVRATGAAGLEREVLAAVVGALGGGASQRAARAALRLLREALPAGRNRVRAAEAGAVGAVVELLLDGPEEDRVVETALAVLDVLCGCAEGREALAAHPAGLAAVAAAVGAVSVAATERAVRVLWSVSRHASGQVAEEMAQVGAVAKLCQCARAEGRIAQKAREALDVHARTWRSSPCVPPTLLSAFSMQPQQRAHN